MAYKIEIYSEFEGLWRYNIAVTCGLFDANNVQCGFVSAEDKVAPAVSNLSAAPEGTESRRGLTLEAGDCHHLRMYVYLVPNTMPKSPIIADSPPFPLSIKITYDGNVILHEYRKINQWPGANIEIIAARP